MTSHALRSSGALIAALGFAGILLALYLVGSAWSDRGHEESRTYRLKLEMKDKQRMAASHDEFAAQLQQMKPILPRLEERLPARFDPSTIEKTLRDKARLAGIKIESAAFDKQRRSDFYAELGMNLVVQGSAADFLKFMDDMVRDSPQRIVRAMTIRPLDDKAELRAAMTVTYFRYIEGDE